MSDHPENDTPSSPDNGGKRGVWHAPGTAAAGWKPAQEPSPRVGWRVPSLPKDLTTEPVARGQWHLPNPQDTIYTTDDEIEVSQEQVEATIATAEPQDTGEAPLSPEDMMMNFQKVTLAEPEPEPMAPLSPEDMMGSMRGPSKTRSATDADGDGVDDDVNQTLDLLDDDEDSFSMSELVALASLVEEGPDDKAGAAPSPFVASEDDGTTIDISQLSPAERAVMGASTANDDEPTQAIDYAKDQLRRLQEGGTTTPISEAQPTTTVGSLLGADATSDPAEYARRQLAQLGGDTGPTTTYPASPPPPTPQVQQIDPRQAELAQKFRHTEDQVRALRELYQSGQITYDDYQQQLRQLLVLDDNQVYWMMGVESDKWYRYDTPTEQWVEDVPSVLSASQQDTYYQLPRLDPTQPQFEPDTFARDPDVTERFGDTPLPKPVDVRDPYATVVNPSLLEFEDQPDYMQPTVQHDPYGARTVPSARYPDDAVIEAPYLDEPPDYDVERGDPAYYRDAERRRQQSTRRLVITALGILLACGIISSIMFVAGSLLWYNGIASQWEAGVVALADYEPEFLTVRILDAEGGTIATLSSQQGGARDVVTLDQISPYMIFAVLALENERFYEDPGWDLIAIFRAFLQNVTAGEIQSGASTITQQVARNLVLGSTDPTAERKINEVVVANEIASRYSKNHILSLYLNEFNFGNGNYGVEAASQFYFGIPASELNLPQAAMLASIIQAPAEFDPVTRPGDAVVRMRATIQRMLEVECLQFQHGDWPQRGPFCINEESRFVQADGSPVQLLRLNDQGQIVGGIATFQIAEIEGTVFQPRSTEIRYPHFVNFVVAQVEAEYGTGAMFQRGFTIHTTIVPRIQNAAEDALSRQIGALRTTNVNNGAVMVTNPRTGAIWAMVGSADFYNEEIDGQVDNTRAWHQPGSSIKPFLYIAALQGRDINGDGALGVDEYYTPATIVWDVRTCYNNNTYCPTNDDLRFHGPLPVRDALQNSYNVPAVKTIEFIGPQAMADTAAAMGVPFFPDSPLGLPTALGANEVRLFDMMRGYGTIANDGISVPLFAIVRITERGEDGQEREVPWPGRGEPVPAISPAVAYIMQSILSDDPARSPTFGANSNLTLPNYPTTNYVGAKTGTSQDRRDLWTMGFTSNVVVGVWLGRTDNQPTFNTGGFVSAAPIWNAVMRVATQGLQPEAFVPPASGVVAREVCRTTGTLAGAECTERAFVEVLGDRPPPNADQGFVQTVQIDTWTQLRSNQFCPEFTVTRVFSSINDPFAIDWLNNTQQGQQYAQRVGLPLPLEQAPTQACQSGMPRPTARIINPQPNQTLMGTVQITGQVSAADFNRYQMEYAVEGTQDYVIIGEFSTTQHPNAGDVLATWQTNVVPSGRYVLRLMMFSNTGGFVEVRVPVTLDNPLPTATPTQLPTFTPLPPQEATGDGFAPPPVGPGAPTPTATINPIG